MLTELGIVILLTIMIVPSPGPHTPMTDLDHST